MPSRFSAFRDLLWRRSIPVDAGSSSQDLPRSESRSLLSTFILRQHNQETITCYDYLGIAKSHGPEQRYVSPTTGICRKLIVQSVNPKGPGEQRIMDHTTQASRLAMWLVCTNPFYDRVFFKWISTCFFFSLKLLWSFIWFLVQFLTPMDLTGNSDSGEDSAVYNTGYYKPYQRPFVGQLWAARSRKEYSSRFQEGNEQSIPIHSLYPRLLMLHDATKDQWIPCTDPDTIIRTKYIAISYCAADIYSHSHNPEREKEDFIKDVHAAVVRQNFDAYWLDLECLGQTPEEKKLDLYCMADVYRSAELTLIMLGDSDSVADGCDAWKRWGDRVWTLPEALLSQRLHYKFRDRAEIESVSLRQLANLAYAKHDLEQPVINAYSGKDPLERLERLTLLKGAIWRRGITLPQPISKTAPVLNVSAEKAVVIDGPYTADRVYALMGFFEHRIQPSRFEDELRALARLSMANDNDRIAERMVSLLPSTITRSSCWYADHDVYWANLWDVIPEIQVAGITENGALVLDGCKASSIRWKDFPEIAFDKSDSVRRTVVGFLPQLSWPIIIVGLATWLTGVTVTGGITLFACGFALLVFSPRLFVFSESGRVMDAQPWLIGIKGVLDIDKAAVHLYGGGNKGRYPRLGLTPSGSEFAVPEQGKDRGGSRVQYDLALRAEQGSQAGRTYTLIDTYSSTVYYFCADKPPTVCLFTGREGGLGRFVLCSERCEKNELHKETVLRMPTEVSQKMELCGWVALG
ncbi:hypothetical protein JVU11DRAFT_10911 [Chiua virens]|nr:hypothetical protein JVU11DRAFT_10911 [Chiua virens]